MTTRIAALAEALHKAQAGCPDNPTYDCAHERDAAAILAALPPDWCGHDFNVPWCHWCDGWPKHNDDCKFIALRAEEYWNDEP